MSIPIDNSVTTAKIYANAVTSAKLAYPKFDKIVDSTLAAAATSIDITGLDLATDKMYIIQLKLKNAVGANDIAMFVNGDTTVTDYYTERIYAMTTGITALNENNANITSIFDTNTNSNVTIFIENNVTGNATARALGNCYYSAGLSMLDKFWAWTGTNNLIRLTFTGSVASGLAIGCRIMIFKVSG